LEKAEAAKTKKTAAKKAGGGQGQNDRKDESGIDKDYGGKGKINRQKRLRRRRKTDSSEA